MDGKEGCVLCASRYCSLYALVGDRGFLRCTQCELIFAPSHFHLSAEAERKRYSLHTNTVDNCDYVRYLQNVAAWISKIPVQDPTVLDFGSGENHVLTDLLIRQGIRCTAYDPLYQIGEQALSCRYDIVVACEVLEHLRNLRDEVERMRALLKPGGYLFLRTELVPTDSPFAKWWYVQDPTHINFFSRRTLEVLCEILELSIYESDGRRVFVLQKNSPA